MISTLDLNIETKRKIKLLLDSIINTQWDNLSIIVAKLHNKDNYRQWSLIKLENRYNSINLIIFYGIVKILAIEVIKVHS